LAVVTKVKSKVMNCVRATNVLGNLQVLLNNWSRLMSGI